MFTHSPKSTPIIAIPNDNSQTLINKLSKFEKAWVNANEFSGTLGETLIIPDEHGKIAKILFGIGNQSARERTRLHLGSLPFKLPKGAYQLEGEVPKNAELAWALGCYQFRKYLSATTKEPASLSVSQQLASQIEPIAQACALTQDLINEPANIMTPDRLADEVHQLAKSFNASFTEIKGQELISQNFPMIHAVGRASTYAPRLLELTWGTSSNPSLTIVGKGVCFDTGGLDIKPSSSMKLMKKDMGGAANAIGLAQMMMSMKLPIHLRLLIPAVENAISANAFRPGDVLTARDGQTVEINNTDAEGRLVLADALTYAAEHNPGHIISLATLTGAARVAVGPDIAPFYSTENDFATKLTDAAQKVEDPVWRLPFWAPYEDMIEPKQAQLDNAPAGGMAGSITAALFLKRFTKNLPYTHFDIYGWNPSEKPARAFGGAAQAIRAIFEAIK